MKTYGGGGCIIHVFLTSVLVEGEGAASHLGLFNPLGRAIGTHWIAGWVEPRTGLDDVNKREFLTPTGTRTPLDWHLGSFETFSICS
jgi:hypothetical protein